ncbi:MAG TPA: MDR family MFS transporter [Candidatus Saccharimonadales bacterium]|nr:MDR family MFS transporter [Candidatus Saccharimonadales bacterium]
MSTATSKVAPLAQPSFHRPDMTKRQILLVMIGLMLTMFLAVLDQTVVSTALWTIVKELDPANGLNHMSWLITAYILASTATQPLYGKISDLYGRKKIFMAAIALFIVGSALCGFANSMSELIAYRVVQGLGAGGLMSLVMAIMGDMISPRERGKWSGMFGLIFGVGSVAGPLIGGFLTDAHHFLGLTTSWRWVFFINVPLGILALAVVQKVLHLPKFKREHHIDYFGAALMVAGVSALLLVTEWGGSQYAWSSPTILGLIAAALTGIGAFLYRESRAKEPILALHLFKNPVFRAGVPLLFILGCALFGSLIYVSLYFQIVNGLSPTAAGLHLIPMTLGMIPTSIIVGRIITKTGRYKIFPIVGMACVTIAMVLLGRLTVDTSSLQLSAYLFLLGVGMGQVMQVVMLAIQNATPPREMGAGTAATGFFRSLGGAIGSAAFGAILTSRLAANLPQGSSAAGGMPSADAIHQLPAAAQQTVMEAFTRSTNTVFLVAAALTAAGFVISLFLKEVRLRSDTDQPETLAKGKDAQPPQTEADVL